MNDGSFSLIFKIRGIDDLGRPLTDGNDAAVEGLVLLLLDVGQAPGPGGVGRVDWINDCLLRVQRSGRLPLHFQFPDDHWQGVGRHRPLEDGQVHAARQVGARFFKGGWTLAGNKIINLGDHKPRIELAWLKKNCVCDVITNYLHCDALRHLPVLTWFDYFSLSVQSLSTYFGLA